MTSAAFHRRMRLFLLLGCGLAFACQSPDKKDPTPTELTPTLLTPPTRKFPTAIFALGDFWIAEARYGGISGVVFTEVGYTAGTTPSPSYDNIGDHVQAIRVAYDPDRVSYKELLNAFWRSHNPVDSSTRREYQCMIFYANDEEETIARASRKEMAGFLKNGGPGRGGFILRPSKNTPMKSRVEEANTFFPAERLHQKYRLQQYPYLCQALKDLLPKGRELLATTIAVRFNAFMGGQILSSDLRRESAALAESDDQAKGYEAIIDQLTRPPGGGTQPR